MRTKATVERPDIPNTLNRAFDVEAPNQVWCGGITYVWAQGKWHYLAVVLDLYARRVVGWALSEKPDGDLVVKALDVAYEQRGKPQGLLFHSRDRNMAAVSSARDCGATAFARA
jgi:putative transposase